MRLEAIESTSLAIPFKAAFKHAAAERGATQTVWVEARAAGGQTGYGEGCPREYVTAESLASAHAMIARHRREWLDTVDDLEALRAWAQHHRAEIDANPAAWCAVELALLDLLGKIEEQSVEALLGLPELSGNFAYTAVIGDLAPEAFETQLARYCAAGFACFKIKLSGDPNRDRDKVRALERACVAPEAVRADANNLWRDADAAGRHLTGLDYPFCAVEEPLRAGDFAGMRRLAAALGTRIVLDESLVRVEQLRELERDARTWIANLRVSKLGGLLRSLEFVSLARAAGFQIVVGAHVGETSLLTRAALTIANCSRDLLFAQEGAFGTHLLTHDMVQPSLMFGAGGILEADQVPADAFGFSLL